MSELQVSKFPTNAFSTSALYFPSKDSTTIDATSRGLERCLTLKDSTLMMQRRIQQSWRGRLERNLEGIVVVGMRMRASVCAVEAASRLILNWSDFSRVLKGFKGIS